MIKLKVFPQFPSSVEAGPGVTITKLNGIWTIGFDFTGSVGSAVQAWDPDLDAISAFSGLGFAVRTDDVSSLWAQRTITGTANEVTLTNGNGVSGDPVVSLPSALTFTGKTVTGGTFVTPSIATIVNTGTLTLPTSTDTLVGRATTDTLTNKTFDTAGAGNSLSINGLAATANTGTGAVVRATSPTLVTPALGTPTAIVLTNGAGLPISTGVSGLATGVATFLATPSSANLRAALTDEVGTGAAYFVGGALGTPASGTATNLTGLPVSTGIAGLGTGVAAFLATPSSANLAAAMTDETGSGANVFATSPTLVTPVLGVATATSVTAGATAIIDNTGGASRFIDAGTAGLNVQYGTGAAGTGGGIDFYTRGSVRGSVAASAPDWTLGVAGASQGTISLTGATSGSTKITALAAASGILTLPSTTDTLVGKSTTDTLTNKTIDTATSTLKVGGVTISAGQYPGVAAATNATAGNIGEYIEATLVQGSATSLVATTATNITSISLTAGDWDVSAIFYNTVQAPYSAVATWSYTRGSISATSATMDFTAGRFLAFPAIGSISSSDFSVAIPDVRMSLASTTTIYLVEQSNYTGGSVGGYGTIRARRVH